MSYVSAELVFVSPRAISPASEGIGADGVASSPIESCHKKPVQAGLCACMRRRRRKNCENGAKSQRYRGFRLKNHQSTAIHCIAAYLRFIWLETLFLALFGILVLALHFVPNNFPNPPLMPFWTQVPLVGDVTIKNLRIPIEFLYPYQKPPVSNLACAAMVIVVPIAVIAIFQLKIRSVWDFHAGQVGVLKAVTTTSLIVLIFKLYIGGFRPHFFDVCRPNMTLLNEQIAKQGPVRLYFNSTFCTGDRALVKNALQSFPSGHSANSFATATFLALYMNAKLKTIGDHAANYWAFVVTITPLVLASILAAMMYITHQHHMRDIHAGTAIGLIIGTVTYRSVYATIFDSRYNHIPLPPFAAKTRFRYSGGTFDSTEEFKENGEDEVDKLVVWNWWNHDPCQKNKEKEQFWLRNIRSTRATGCERDFWSEPTLPQNEEDVVTKDCAERIQVKLPQCLKAHPHPCPQCSVVGLTEASDVYQV